MFEFLISNSSKAMDCIRDNDYNSFKSYVENSLNLKYSKFLYTAAQRGNLEIVNLLIDHRVTIDEKTTNGFTPLTVAISEGHIEIVKVLIQAGANINIVAFEGHTPLLIAVAGRKYMIVKLLLKNGADINCTLLGGYNGLMGAADNEDFEMVKLLLKNGINKKHKTISYGTALDIAKKTGNAEIIQYIKEK